MELVFASEHRFYRDSKGDFYSDSPAFGPMLWSRYLSVFDHVSVFARVCFRMNCSGMFPAGGENISFIEIPYYVGLSEYLKKYRTIRHVIEQNSLPGRAYICRVPGRIGEMLASSLRKKSIPYAVEVVGDPWDVFAPGSISHPLRPFLRINNRRLLYKTVFNAAAALYVTEYKLQQRYPVRKNAFQTHASNVHIIHEDISAHMPKVGNDGMFDLISIGSLAQMYKSPDIAIKAVKLLCERGIDCRLTWLGDGYYREHMEMLSEQLGIRERIIFKGNVSENDVRKFLRGSDLFILASRTEGLPRAMIEAMSVGLPCIGTKVGGIPELLESCALVAAGSAPELADKIEEFIKNEELLSTQSLRNYEKSAEYDERVLDRRRKMFYEKIGHLSH